MTFKNRINNFAADHGRDAAQDEFLNSLMGEVPVDIRDAEEQIESILERHEEYLAARREWYRNVMDDRARNADRWVQPVFYPQWYDNGRTWREDDGYYVCQLKRIAGLVEEAKAEVDARIKELEAVADAYFPEHDREHIEIQLPTEGEAFMSFLKDTIDTHAPDRLVLMQAVADDMRARGALNLKDYLTAETVLLDRLNRKCYDERAGWYWDLQSAKERLKNLKCFDNAPGENYTKGEVPLMPDEATDLIHRAQRLAGNNQSKENVMACLEAILKGDIR